jgi:CBS domain containing-hemolysin-like protein
LLGDKLKKLHIARVVSTWVFASIVVVVCAAASFFFSLAETALFSLSKWQGRRLAERGGAGAVAAELLASPQDLLATLVLGNTLANAGMIAVGFWLGFSGGWPQALTVAVVVLLILVGGEVLPKTLAVRRPEVWTRRVARALAWFHHATRPLHQSAQRLNALLLRVVVPKSVLPQGALTDAEYQELVEVAFQQGTLAAAEKEIILQIIQLDRRTAKDVMQPLSRMGCIPDDLSIEEMIAAARKFKHRRLPMYDGSPDTIVGILNTRALLLDPNIDLVDAIEFPSFVPETMNLLQLLKSLQRQQRGMAIVLSEFGGTAGLVTTEDILGEVVGKIRSSVESKGFVMEKLAAGRWRLNGTMRLDDFRREHPALASVVEVETMGGLLTHLLGIVPAAGDSVQWGGLRLKALVVDERRVKELEVEVVR